MISGLGIIRSGADAIWFHGSAVLFTDFILVIAFTLTALALTFAQVFSLTGNRMLLKRRAEAVLQWKLDNAIYATWAITSGNEQLLVTLRKTNDPKIEQSIFAPPPEDWSFICAPQGFKVADVDAPGLIAFVNRLPRRPIATDTQGPTAVVSDTSLAGPHALLLFACGQRFAAGGRMVALSRSYFPDINSEDVWEDFNQVVKLVET